MARWLILQADGEHKGQDQWKPNWYLRECYGFEYALRSLGHEVDIWGKNHSNYVLRPDFESYDFVLVLDNYETGWLPNLEDIKKPKKIQWIVDLHNQQWGVYKSISKCCDVILHATKMLIEPYERFFPEQQHIWFPCCIDERYYTAPRRTKKHDVAFVGSRHGNRENFIAHLEQEVGLKYQFATGFDMIEAIASAKIHVNQPISVDINARTFETLGAGACLLTYYDPSLVELGFVDKLNCLLYNHLDEAVVKVKESLADGSWQEIGDNGFELSKRHTYQWRMKELLKEIL